MPLTKPNNYKFTLNSVDVTSHVFRSVARKGKQPIKTCTILLREKVSDVLPITSSIIGKTITIQRGFAASTERYIFRGEVISKKRDGGLIELTCACKMHRAKRLELDYVYDEVIDPEGGVGSEIVKSLFNNAGLNYNATSVPTTGAVNTLKTFLAKGTIKDSLELLGKIYGRVFFYRDSDDLAYFIEPKSESTSTVLNINNNVVGRITWTDTGEDIINNLTVIGGKQLDWTEESFTGSFDDVTLTATPIDTDITVGGVQLQRGVTSSEPNDFYVEPSNKKIVFTTTQTDPVVRYNYSVPIKVNVSDTTSISNTYQVDKTIIDTKLMTSDDAELEAQGIIDNNKDVLTNAPIRVVGNNDLEVGQEVQVIDSINDVNVLVNVTSVQISYPYQPDQVNVGLLPRDDLDLDEDIRERIAELERQLSTTSDVNVSIITGDDAVIGLEVYTKVEVADADTGVLYWDSDVQGDWGNDAGSTGYNWGTDTEETYTEVYKEVGFDD